MGYRSDIALAVRKEDYELLKIEKKENKDLMDLLDIADDSRSNDKITILRWNSIKWYDSFQEVQEIENFMYELDDKNAPYKFIRIGEDYSDTEIKSNWGDSEKYGEDCVAIDSAISLYRDIDIYL